MILGEPGERGENTFLAQQRKRWPSVANLLRGPFTAGLKHIHRSHSFIMVRIEPADRIGDSRRVGCGGNRSANTSKREKAR